MLVALLGVTAAGAAGQSDYRLAAIIAKGADSMALVEDKDGKQSWYRIDDEFGGQRVVYIDADGITLLGAEGESRLLLAAGQGKATPARQAPVEDPVHQSRNYQYTALLSRINAIEVAPGESRDMAVARNMNEVLGLAKRSRITSIDRVKVETPSQAHAELANRLQQGEEAIRISVDNDARVLYVTPE